MLKKPDSCKPCPLYGDGKGYVKGVYPDAASLLVIGSVPPHASVAQGYAFAGYEGEQMASTYLPLAGVAPESVAYDNTLRCRYKQAGKKGAAGKLPMSVLDQAIQCCSQYDQDPSAFELVIVQGDIALRKFDKNLKSHEWRGHCLPQNES